MFNRSLLLIVAILLLAPSTLTSSAHGFPIRPRTLRELCEVSDWIVYAEAAGKRDSTYVASRNRTYQVTIAQLQVIEFFKHPGQEETSSGQDAILEVPYHADLVCPEPPSYHLRRRILAFLSAPDSNGYHYTVELSHGTKALAAREVPGWRSAISEYVELLQLDDSEAREQLNEWFLRHFRMPGVGDVLAHELSYSRERWKGRDQPPPRSQWRPNFTREQQLRLAQALREDLDWNSRGISQFLLYPHCVAHADEATLHFMVESLVAHGSVPGRLYGFLILLADRLGQEGCRIIAEEIVEFTGPEFSTCERPSRSQQLAMEVLQCLR